MFVLMGLSTAGTAFTLSAWNYFDGSRRVLHVYFLNARNHRTQRVHQLLDTLKSREHSVRLPLQMDFNVDFHWLALAGTSFADSLFRPSRLLDA